MIGAFSMGEAFPKEPVGMVTPIEDMLEAWDPKIPQQPTYFQPAEKQPAPLPPPPTRRAEKTRQEHTGTASLTVPAHTQEHRAAAATDHGRQSRRSRSLVLNARAARSAPSAGHGRDAPRHHLCDRRRHHRESRTWFQKELDKRGYAVTL